MICILSYDTTLFFVITIKKGKKGQINVPKGWEDGGIPESMLEGGKVQVFSGCRQQ